MQRLTQWIRLILVLLSLGTAAFCSAQATKAGATVMKPAFDVPGVGRIVILLEPGGAGIGWMTPADA